MDLAAPGSKSVVIVALRWLDSCLELTDHQGMESLKTAEEADDSYWTLGVGRSLP